jgi:uncharacterized Zn-finger protein
VCQKAYYNDSSLKQHMNIHKGFRSHICDICGKAFNLPHTLRVHMNIHLDPEKYKCETCGRGFAQMTTLVKHRTKHTGERKYPCDVCAKAFKARREESGEKIFYTNSVSPHFLWWNSPLKQCAPNCCDPYVFR